MTIPHASFLFGGLGSTGIFHDWGELIEPSKTTEIVNRHYLLKEKTAALIEGMPQPTVEERELGRPWGEDVGPSKTVAILNRHFLTVNKTAAFTEVFPAPTEDEREMIMVDWGDSVLPSKTKGIVDSVFPEWVSVDLDTDSCPGDPVTADLVWDIGGYTGWTMTIQRRNDTTWGNVVSGLTAGETTYSDTGASEVNTNNYRIKFDVAGAEWVEFGLVELICPV